MAQRARAGQAAETSFRAGKTALGKGSAAKRAAKKLFGGLLEAGKRPRPVLRAVSWWAGCGVSLGAETAPPPVDQATRL